MAVLGHGLWKRRFGAAPALVGGSKVVAWSYPIIYKGLIYYVDVRNGLYIVKYTGPLHQAVDRITFLEGNSNLGDALRLAGIDRHTPSQ